MSSFNALPTLALSNPSTTQSTHTLRDSVWTSKFFPIIVISCACRATADRTPFDSLCRTRWELLPSWTMKSVRMTRSSCGGWSPSGFVLIRTTRSACVGGAQTTSACGDSECVASSLLSICAVCDCTCVLCHLCAAAAYCRLPLTATADHDYHRPRLLLTAATAATSLVTSRLRSARRMCI